MKILHIIPNLKKGGAERLVVDIVRGLSLRKDVSVKLILFDDQIEYPIEDIKDHILIVPSFVTLSVLNRRKMEIKELQQNIDSFEPNVIHTHLFAAEIITRSCFYPNAKWFSHCHDNMRQLKGLSMKTFLDKKRLTDYYEKLYLLKRYNKNGGNNFIAISRDTEEYFKKALPKKRAGDITLLHNAIDVSRFTPTVTKSRHNALRLINIGSFVENKNQLFLIKVIKELVLRNIPVELILIGEGVFKEAVMAYAKSLNVDSFVSFLGNINDVEKYLFNADIYVHSAKKEAFGLALLEAMAAGLPVVSLDGKGNRDVVEDGKNGYLLSSHNVPEFADKVVEVSSNEAFYNQLSEYAQEYVKKFDTSSCLQKLFSLYKEGE